MANKKKSDFKFMKGAVATSIKSIKYSATELTIDRMPFTTNTVTNSINMAKDLHEWTRRNNPFKAVNGNKDPLVRQIATASMKGLRAAKQDLMHGDLRFSRLNKEFRAFVGGEDPEHAFDYMDIDYGDMDYSDWGGDSEGGNEDRTTIAVGESISREFTDTQMASTSAMISAVETATDRVSHVSLRASEVATDRLIAANLSNMTRISTQIGQASGELATMNQNISLLVQQGNDVNQFLGQSQKFMENTEQSLNDIKSLLDIIAAPHKEKQNNYRDNTPEWLSSGFDPKGFLKDKMANTMTGMAVSQIIATTFNALKLEIPSFIDDSMPSGLSDLKPLNATLAKLLPAINRFGDIDKLIGDAFKTVLAKVDNGEYVHGNGIISNILYAAGIDGWGFNGISKGHKLFDSSHYNKGTISWNGKSERALQEVIPSYLSNIEGYVKSIAEGLDADRAARERREAGIDTSKFRLYDYEDGSFTNLEKIRKQAQSMYNEAAQSAFSSVMAKIEENVNGGDDFNAEISKVFNDMLTDETQISSKVTMMEFKRVLQKYRKEGKLRDPEIARLINQITMEAKPNAVANLSEIRQSANDRTSAIYNMSDAELWNLRANVQFRTKAEEEQAARNKVAEQYAANAAVQAEKLKEYDENLKKQKAQEEAQKNNWLTRKLKSTEAGTFVFNVWDDLKKHGGVLNRTIEYAQDYGIVNPLINLVHGLKGFAKGTGLAGLPQDEVVAAHKGEIILTREQSEYLRKIVQPFNAKQRAWGTGLRMNLKGEVYNAASKDSSKSKNTQKIKRRKPSNEAERKFMSDVRNPDVEKAQTPEEETLERTREMSDNIATIAANVVQNSEDAESAKRKDNNSKAFGAAFGEVDDDGFYRGKAFSGLANMTIDFKNMMRHAITGEEYTTSAGVKVAKTDDCLNGSVGKSLKTAGDAAARTIFGDDYKDSKFYKSTKGGLSDFFAGLKATAAGQTVDDEFWANKHAEDAKHEYDDKTKSDIAKYMKMDAAHRTRYDGLLAFKLQKNKDDLEWWQDAYSISPQADTAAGIERIQNEISRISRKIEWIDKFNEFGKEGKEDGEAAKAANKALFGVEDISDFGSNIANAAQETGNEAHNKLLRTMKFGAAGAIGIPLAKILGLGAIPSFFLPGGPIGGAILGVGAAILSKNKTVMAHLFGGEDKDGNKIDGIISKDLQDKFKTTGKKILGPATIGAVGGLIFPKAVGFASKALGPVIGSLVGTGPIGGAILASSAALMLGTDKIKNALFGRDEEGNATGLINKGVNKGKQFLKDNKDALKRAGLGTLGGALLGTKIFGLTGLALAPTIFGAAIGMSTMSTKFTDYLFGTKMMKKDAHGNTIWTRDGDGLLGRVARMINLKLLTPVKSFVSNGADRVMEYIRHDIGFSIRSMFAPLTVPIKDSVANLTKAFKKIGDKATKLAKKFFDPLLKLGGGLLSGFTRLSLGVTKFVGQLAGGILSAPLKLLGGIGNLFTKKNSKKVREANHNFKKDFFWKALNPLAWGERIVKKTNVKGFGNKVSGFMEALNPFEAYSEERLNYAKAHGLEGNTAFMSGILGGERKKHKNIMLRINKQEALDRDLQALAREYAKRDHGNNKIQLKDSELRGRNRDIRKAYNKAGIKYENMTNDQMMKFIYDPLGKRGENKQRMLENEEKRHAEMKNIVEQIRTGVSHIADLLAMTPEERRKQHAKIKNSNSKAYHIKNKGRGENSETDKAIDDMAGVKKNWWERYQDRFVDNTVGRVKRKITKTKRRFASIGGHIARGATNFVGGVKDFGHGVADTAKAVGHGAATIGKGIAFGAKALKGSADDAWDRFSGWAMQDRPSLKERFDNWKNRDKEAGKEKKRKLKREYGVYKTDYKRRKSQLNKLRRAVDSGKDVSNMLSADEARSLGLDPEQDLNEQVREKAGSMKKLSKRGFKKAETKEVALQATKGSLMEMLTKKKSILVGLGTVAIGALVTTAVVKFPKIIDWFKDKAVPFIKNTIWPFIKGAVNAIGKLLCGIGDFVRGGQKATTKFLNFMSSGTWEDPEITEAKDQLNKENGLQTDAEFKKSIASTSMVTAVSGKKKDKFERIDYLAAALAYTGQMYRSSQGSDTDVTADDILKYLNSSNKDLGRKGKSISRITNGVYNKILNKVAPHELAKGHSIWRDVSSDDLHQAALMAAQYLNNERAAASELIEQNSKQGSAADETSVGAGHFMQTDPRWRNRKYANSNNGFSTIGNGGCGPTALANVAVQNGIRTNPLRIAAMAQSSGYTAQGGTNARLFNEGVRRLGLNSNAIGREGIKRALANGRSVIFAGKGHGFYTGAGHIMSARGLDRHGNAIVDDPLRRRSISVPISKIGNGLTNAWSIGRGDAGYSEYSAVSMSGSEKTKSYGEYMNALYSGKSNVDGVDAIKNANATTQYTDNDIIMNSTDTKTTAEYMMHMAKQGSQGDTKYRDMYNLMRRDSIAVKIRDGWSPAYYAQVDDAWCNKKMLYSDGGGSTYYNGGCVISALGSLLANITGLNYRPDAFDAMASNLGEMSGSELDKGETGLARMLKAVLPPSLKSKSAHRLKIRNDMYNMENHDARFTRQDVVDPNNMITGQGAHDSTTASGIFRNNVLTNPFVLYGGRLFSIYSPSVELSAFNKANNSGIYDEHAVLVIPSDDNVNYSGANFDPDAVSYYILNPGTGLSEMKNGYRYGINTGKKLTYSELFDIQQGISSMFVIDGAVKSINRLKTATGGSVSKADGDWFNKIYDQSQFFGKVDTYTDEARKEGAASTSTSADVAARAAEIAKQNESGSSSGSSDDSFLSKLIAALGKLGNIATNMLGAIFGGKYKSIYDISETAYSTDSGSSSSSSNSYVTSNSSTASWKYTMDDRINEYISNDPEARAIMMSGNIVEINKLRENIKKKLSGATTDTAAIVANLTPTGMTKYTRLPGYAKKFAGKLSLPNNVTEMPTSSRLDADDVANIEEAMSRLAWEHETHGDYANIIDNDKGGISVGIGGFHNANTMELLLRMQNSGTYTGDDKKDLDDIIANGFDISSDGVYMLRPEYKNALARLLDTEVSHQCQDAMVQQEHMSALVDLLAEYDNGTFDDPRSLMALGQFQGFGQYYIPGMMGHGTSRRAIGYPDAFRNRKYDSSEELANTIKAANVYYSAQTKNYEAGHKNRFRDVYNELGGTQSLGFGAGIRDSYNTYGYYDSVDTPVAINSKHKVVIEDQPITSRLDMIIEYMRRIVAMTNVSQTATTAKDNLDLGSGLANDMTLKNAGLQRNETLPIYRKENTNPDKMRAIHNKIARSPRTVS